MSRQIVHTADAAQPPRTYSQAVRAGGLVFVSGTGPYDPETGALVGATIQEQVRILAAAGSSLDRVASATVILREDDDFAGLNEEWLRWFPTDPPARQAARLPVKVEGLRVSIAVVAEAHVNHTGIR
jgi:2-iminobutanoate/2-iminopropanoate deaminase